MFQMKRRDETPEEPRVCSFGSFFLVASVVVEKDA